MIRVFACALVALAFAAPASAQLVTPQKQKALRALLPAIDDPEMKAAFADPELVFYTDAEMPAAYQKWDGLLQGVHSPDHNISADPAENAKGDGRGGNGNIEFPWKSPGGTDRAKVYVFRFVRLPRIANHRLPIVWFRARMTYDQNKGYRWIYPVGTVVGEVFVQIGPDGKGYPFEVRIRVRQFGGWTIDAFRPYRNAGELAHEIKRLRPQWQSNPRLILAVRQLEQTAPNLPYFRLADRTHPTKTSFDAVAAVDELPDLGDDELVKQLLRKPFKSVQGGVWRTSSQGFETFAPSTQARFHIVPARYDAGYIEIEEHSCRRCHESANRHVNEFDAARDWYGRVRGSDRIFSFHPFALESISRSGSSLPVSMRAELEQAGVIEQYDGKKHDGVIYHTLGPE